MQFRESGLSCCQSDAMDIAEELKIEKILPAKRQKRTPRHFDCDSAAEETLQSRRDIQKGIISPFSRHCTEKSQRPLLKNGRCVCTVQFSIFQRQHEL